MLTLAVAVQAVARSLLYGVMKAIATLEKLKVDLVLFRTTPVIDRLLHNLKPENSLFSLKLTSKITLKASSRRAQRLNP